MEKQKTLTTQARPRVKRNTVPVVIEGAPSKERKAFLKQGTTWAGVFTIAATLASGGVAALFDPFMISQIGTGLALLIAEN